MKKNYITPAVRCINLDAEALIATSNIGKSSDALENENQILSNERETASSSIWGED